jgi:hypothetical protein
MGKEMEMEENALAALGLTVEEVQEVDDALRRNPKRRDGRVCLCGHAVARHTEVAGHVVCKPSRMDCPCKVTRAVLDVEDLRPFLRRTEGSGALHALTRGLSELVSNEKKAEWIVELVCDRCKVSGAALSPVPVTQTGHATTYATGFDALLCRDCRENV